MEGLYLLTAFIQFPLHYFGNPKMDLFYLWIHIFVVLDLTYNQSYSICLSLTYFI